MKIIVDAFGGDNAPTEILKGCELAQKELGADIILSGEEAKIRNAAKVSDVLLAGMSILPAAGVMEIEDNPGDILKAKRGSSMGTGLDALAAGKGAAFVSAGSTAALVMGAAFLVKRAPGVKRVAIGAVMPTAKGSFLLADT
ncbi:MAG: phosphate--acyl-ACP acyltransferase, partial [Oscillospiraceae bacterium]|nr:phosphate--acyl-ACP acyltransferase [Oscillospiraceae bacterium]